ncbi:MAG TPA: hypothetical protein VGB97_00745 [Candidatus Paceibacterota bacterium]|jgi:hypothetical protein
MFSFTGFRGRSIDIPAGAPAAVSQSSLKNMERILEASSRVEQRLGIRVDSTLAHNALACVKNQAEIVAALQQHKVHILDFDAVRRHQQKRVRRTVRERFSDGWYRIWDLADEYLLHGWTGKTSAWIALFTVIPLGIPLLIDLLWYNVHFSTSYLGLFALQAVFSCAYYYDSGRDILVVGRLFASINYFLFGVPLRICAWLIASWFMGGSSGREWKTLSVKEFMGTDPLPVELALIMDSVLQAAPRARLVFETLINADGSRDGEAFLAIDAGDLDDDEIHVWHIRK